MFARRWTASAAVALIGASILLTACGGRASDDQASDASTITSTGTDARETPDSPYGPSESLSPASDDGSLEAASTPVWSSGTFHVKTPQGYSAEVKVTLHEAVELTSLDPICATTDPNPDHRVVRAIEADVDSRSTTDGSFSSDPWQIPLSIDTDAPNNLNSYGYFCGTAGGSDSSTGDGNRNTGLDVGDGRKLWIVWTSTATPNNPDGFSSGQYYWDDLMLSIPLTGTCTGTVSGGGFSFDDTDCGFIRR